MFSAEGLFLGLKSKISHEQNVIYFQFYVRLSNFRLLGSIIKIKSLSKSIPLSILCIYIYRLFFETQSRKHGRNLKLGTHAEILSVCIYFCESPFCFVKLVMVYFYCNITKLCIIANKIMSPSKGVRLSEKLQFTAALCNEI